MCFWFKRKPDVESSFDPRVGNSHITSPLPGAYADPVSPPNTITLGAVPTPEPTPIPPQMSSIAEVSQQSSPMIRRDSEKISPRTEVLPSQPALQCSQPSPHQSAQPSSPRQNVNRTSNSTQFSSHHSISGSPSPELSSKWAKSPDIDQNHSSPPSRHHSASNSSNSPGHPPTGLNRAQSSQSGTTHSGTTSPAPMPVHQAYRAPDQLSIGAKLSPGLTVNSSSTPPTTGGLHTSTSNFSYGGGNSTTTSPIDGRNLWGTKSATASPIDGRNPWISHRESMNSASYLVNSSNAIKEEEKAVKPPWERSIPVAVVPLPAAPQEKPEDLTKETVKKEERKDDRSSRMTKIHIPTLPSFKLGSAPKKVTKQQREAMEMSPETASPSPIDQWPGRM